MLTPTIVMSTIIVSFVLNTVLYSSDCKFSETVALGTEPEFNVYIKSPPPKKKKASLSSAWLIFKPQCNAEG